MGSTVAVRARKAGERENEEGVETKKGKGEPAASLLWRHHTTSSLLPLAAAALAAAERRATQKREMGREQMNLGFG
jgi:hypothetical protein